MEYLMDFDNWCLYFEAHMEEMQKPFYEEHYTKVGGVYISKETVEELKSLYGLDDEDIQQIAKDVQQNELGGGIITETGCIDDRT